MKSGLLADSSAYDDLIISFTPTEMKSGQPPGFRDNWRVWWQIVTVEDKNARFVH